MPKTSLKRTISNNPSAKGVVRTSSTVTSERPRFLQKETASAERSNPETAYPLLFKNSMVFPVPQPTSRILGGEIGSRLIAEKITFRRLLYHHNISSTSYITLYWSFCMSVFFISRYQGLNNLKKTSLGISTRPMFLSIFLPFFCFSSNLSLRVRSPPYSLPVTSLRKGAMRSEAIIFPLY